MSYGGGYLEFPIYTKNEIFVRIYPITFPYTAWVESSFWFLIKIIYWYSFSHRILC